MNKQITLTVNGKEYQLEVPFRLLLVDLIRDELKLTGTHQACTFEGVCGACTVLLNGEAIKSCMMLAVQADGQDITTVEGLEKDGKLHPLQESFNEHHALQCGFCTSGILMNAVEFLNKNPEPSEDEIRHALIGNICRCTGYKNIVKAIKEASRQTAG